MKNKKIALGVIACLLSSCAGSKMTVMRNDLVVDTHCPQKTQVMTLLKKRNGTILKKCGYWGIIGDQIRSKKGLILENQDDPNLHIKKELENKPSSIINNQGDLKDGFLDITKNIK